VNLGWRFVLVACVASLSDLNAQVVVTPRSAKGGEIQGEPWAKVPESFRKLKFPEWRIPTDRDRWQTRERAEVRKNLLDCLGEMPPRPDPHRVRVTSREEELGYILERFEFDNGVDATVPGI